MPTLVPLSRWKGAWPSGSVLLVVVAGALLATTPAGNAFAQEGILTVDYFGYPQPWYPWSLEANAGVSGAMTHDGWRDYYAAATMSWQPKGWLRLDGSGEFHATVDPLFVNSTEIRPMLLAAGIWPTQGGFLNLYNPEINARLDYRVINYAGDVEDVVKLRIRFQLSGKFTVNDTTLSIGTFYIPWALERYADLDGDPKERAAYMWRWRAGVGYVVSGFLRAEVQYISSRVRDTVADPFELTSRTVWFILRHYY